MTRRKYPRVGRIETVKPQGKCFLCGKVKSLDKEERPGKRIHVEVNWFRGDDDVYKAHNECLKNLPKNKLLSRIMEILSNEK